MIRPGILALSLLVFTDFSRAEAAHISQNLLPSPRAATDSAGRLPAAFTATIETSGATDAEAIRLLKTRFPSGPAIPVRLVGIAASGIPPEGYRLNIASGEITVTAGDAAGLYHGVRTLLQLAALHPEGVPAGTIDDSPAFGIRGFMHDTGRNFRTVESLKADLDRLAAYKLNVFHWHLTDNPAWRIECQAYPKLNDPAFRVRGRDENATYSYAQIRDVIAYAKARHIRVIPELDMPGHSAYFAKAFGFGMGDRRALPILEKLLEEFCAEIPKEDCPILHIGSDEVHIAAPDAFIKRIGDKVIALGRTPMIWNPGLKNDGRYISQLWREAEAGEISAGKNAGIVDSGLGYLNAHAPEAVVRRHFFKRTCGTDKGDAARLGGIACLWPDTRVDDKSKIAAQSGQWPGVVSFSENVWRGRPAFPAAYADALPTGDKAALAAYVAFEDTLAVHRDTFFRDVAFPFVKTSGIVWKIAGPIDPKTPDAPAASFRAQGGDITLPMKAPEGTYFEATTVIVSPDDRTILARIGFETPTRSNRQSAGIPKAGEWSGTGASVSVNGAPLPPPVWKNPGAHFEPKPTWFSPANELPLEDEELYWTREPSPLPLKEGRNRIVIRIPARHVTPTHSFAFMPVREDGAGRFIEETSVRFADPTE